MTMEEWHAEIDCAKCDDWDLLEDDDEGGAEPLMCMYCSNPASEGHYTCGRASCVGCEIMREAGWPD